MITKNEMLEFIRREEENFLSCDLYKMQGDKAKLDRIRREKESFVADRKNCLLLKEAAGERVRGFLRQCLGAGYFMRPGFWEEVWLFQPSSLTKNKVQLELLLFIYRRNFGALGFLKLMEDQNGQFMEAGSVNRRPLGVRLSKEEKEDFLVELLYAELYGLGKLELLLPFALDGISCGLNAESGTYPFWVMVSGRSIPLPDLCLEEGELIRIAKRLASACGIGEFHEEKGYCVGDLKNHTRVIILRPPFAEGWTFLLRMYDSVQEKGLEELVTENGAKEVHRLLRLMVKGCQTVGITGMQGSGKTTLLMSLVKEIPQEYTLRVLEQIFELHLRELYPERNVLTIRETDTVSGEEGLNLLKKTDGNVTIIGEVASAKVAAWMIDAGQVASLFTLFTHHAKTVPALVHALRNSLLSEGIFTNEKIAQEQVVEVVRFDVHLEQDRSGRRYISRISEIIPTKNGFRERELLTCRKGGYYRVNPISCRTLGEIDHNLTEEERLQLDLERELQWAEEVESHELAG